MPAAWAGVGLAAIGTAKSLASSPGGGGGGRGGQGPPPVPGFGEGPFWGGFQRGQLSGLPSAATRQRELDFGRADFGGEALGSMRGALPGFMPAPGEDVFRGDLYGAGQDIDALGMARGAFGASIDRYGALGGRALGTEMIARPLVEQGLATPFALGPQTEGLFNQRAAGRRNLLLAEQARAAAGLRERLAGRFGPGYQSGTPFLAGEEEYVTRPYAQGLTQLGISDVEQRLGAAQWQRGYERNILEDAMKTQLQAGQYGDVAARELQRGGLDMATLRSEDARARMAYLQRVQTETPNLMGAPLDALKAVRTIQGGGGGGGPTFPTQTGGSDWGSDLMGLGGTITGEALRSKRHKDWLEKQFPTGQDPSAPDYSYDQWVAPEDPYDPFYDKSRLYAPDNLYTGQHGIAEFQAPVGQQQISPYIEPGPNPAGQW
jgi:hypothetical protein